MRQGFNSAETQAKLKNYQYSNRNPIYKPEVRRKAEMALRLRGYKELHGGNGQPIPLPQQILAAVLGWQTEYPVPVSSCKMANHPTCYKIDIADPILKIGIEVDGESHRALRVKQADRKKDIYLASQGWRILRFRNKKVLQQLDTVLQEITLAIQSTI